VIKVVDGKARLIALAADEHGAAMPQITIDQKQMTKEFGHHIAVALRVRAAELSIDLIDFLRIPIS